MYTQGNPGEALLRVFLWKIERDFDGYSSAEDKTFRSAVSVPLVHSGGSMRLRTVINLFGGPGCGKSTTAAGLLYQCKMDGLSVELCSEYAKDLVYEDRNNVLETDQLYVFAQQHRRLHRYKDLVDVVIMESPLLLSSIYYSPNNIYDQQKFNALVFDTYSKYPNINFLLQREGIPYVAEGRVQSEIEEAKTYDHCVETMLRWLRVPYTCTPTKTAVQSIRDRLSVKL